MPYSLTIPLDAAGASLPPNPARALHATFFDWLERGNPAVARVVHREMETKPFTISSLYPQSEGRLAFRISLLHDDLWPILQAGVSTAKEVDVVGNLLPIARQGLEIVHRPYEMLVAEAGCETQLTLRFLSPTSFRTGPMHYPLPDPHAVFRSYLSRWNAFAPRPLQVNISLLDVVDAHVAVARYRTQTEMVDFMRGRLIGFVGTVSYQVLRSHLLGEDILRSLNVLADYAYFCGTGHKTTQGMGQTRRLPARRRGP
jgi:CRISPR-associated endoribonuclease Cas6